MQDTLERAKAHGWRNGGDDMSGGIDIGDVVQIGEDFLRSLTQGWARGRLRVGDLLVAIAHKGDSFHHYVLLHHSIVTTTEDDVRVQRIHLEPVPAPIVAYRSDGAILSLDMGQLAELMKGESIVIDIPEEYEPQKPVWA